MNSPKASMIDVANDRTSSVKNLTDKTFSGRSWTIAPWTEEVFVFGTGAIYSTLDSSSNDKIDHFDIR